MPGYVYMMSNKKDGPLYTGVTSDLEGHIYEHKTGIGSKFCKRYGLMRLVYCEDHERIEDAIDREKQIKKWRRAWKVNLIETMNPDWDDLFDTLNH
ncbi:MAG: GIY-YIG nuclease family protein [Alphaproteobacteria bacterium]|nr:GIY-YIG nuclease family protein [Alphaproteobacteria bacterium]